MTEPARWQDDSELGRDLRQMLASSAPPEAISEAVMLRSARRVARLAWMPAVMLAFSWKKWALAASGMTSTIIIAFVIHHANAPHEVDATAIPPAQREQPRERVSESSPPTEPLAVPPTRQLDEPSPEPPIRQAREQVRTPETKAKSAEAIVALQDSPQPAATPVPKATEPNEDELTGIARAQSKARSAPNEALALIAEHIRHFPKSKLGLERELVFVEALANAGRTAEARSHALALEPQVKGTLYERRVGIMLERLR